ncbi:MAG: 2-amino-4-hydroxy-6-hydroxymethyldihydropteridine diphosphokinase [Gammaproteobacteria bacterium]|nr:2-amino-4-hydroxy-6-hydroxymethyldihydropteridine diphosphokinase [Gammaproteobacteria bacterium]
MATVYISIGSNVDRKKNIRSCLESLREIFGELKISTVYENKAVGFDGDDFYNLVVIFQTQRDVRELTPVFREIESGHDRVRGGERFSSRTLDVDLLLYDDLILKADGLTVPRDEIIKYAFVLRPLAEISPDLIHPESGETMAGLWQAFEPKEDMRAVDIQAD